MSLKLIKNYFEWDYIVWGQSFPHIYNHINTIERKKRVLEIGSRTGGLAKIFLDMKFMDITISDRDINSREYEAKLNCSPYIKFLDIDLLEIECDNFSKFDVIIVKSVFGALKSDASQNLAISNIYNLLNEGGTLIFLENQHNGILMNSIRKKFTKWGKYWRYRRLQEYDQMLSYLGFKQILRKSYGFINYLFPENFRKIFGFLDVIIADYLIPDKYKYVYFTIVIK